MRIVPSQVVKYILFCHPKDRQLANLYPSMNQPASDESPSFKEGAHGPEHRQMLTAILSMIDAIPGELLTFPPEGQAHFLIARAGIEAVMAEWDRHLDSARIAPLAPLGNENPVFTLYRLLRRCADEAPGADTADLKFVSDAQLRSVLRLDIGVAHSALSNGEWKAATVFAGSVIEALLLWAIQKKPPINLEASFKSAAQRYEDRERADGSTGRFGKYEADVKDWKFFQLIGVAEGENLITSDTAKAAQLTRRYRNLIHSGAAERKAAACNLDTAHIAIGALEASLRDLAKSLT